MGFYGNITNTNKTQFTFDKTYPSRSAMDKNAKKDEVYLGRYVLIEYDTAPNGEGVSFDMYTRLYKDTNNYFYSSANYESTTRIPYTTTVSDLDPSKGEGIGVLQGQIVYIVDNNQKSIFYKCVGRDNGGYAQFELIDGTYYTINYNEDIKTYGAGRGYDSTVWQKVYTQGTEKYVMIAELNTVVPTFDLQADAPTMEPITPHFDADSTNVYYKLHWQPQWGLRVAAAEDYNSDAVTTHESATYDPSSGKITTNTNANIPAAINFNGPAFNPQINKPIDSIKKKDNTENYFTILPTGKSGNKYPKHDGTGGAETREDIQEMRINLPAIGNMMSDAWDIIHGPNRDNNPAKSLQGRLDFFTKTIKENEIPVQTQNGYLSGAHMEDDKWITTNIDGNAGIIRVEHAFTDGEHTKPSYDMNSDNGGKLELYVPNVDDKGHVVGENITTVTLPFGFKTIVAENSNENSDPAMEVENDIVADTTQDTLTISASNKWIKLDTGVEDTVKLGHLLSAQTPTTVGNETLSPKFGDSFNIPRFTTDEAGHVIAASDQTITLQAGSYTPANDVSESTEVITSIGFDAATGDITSTKANSNTLKLASYSGGTDVTDVANGDTYNSAFAKLQNQINALDYNENSTTQIITGINQVDGLISVTRGDAGTLLLTGYELKESEGSDADLLDTDNLKTAFSKLQRQIHVEEAARAAAINALDVSEIVTESYEVISSVSETDGKISASKKKAGALTLADYSKPSSSSAISPSDSLNAALGKLEYKLDTEIGRVDNLDYTDPTANTTQIITKVTQTDGKIEVIRSNAGTLLLTDYNVANNGEQIASTDSINTAFAKLQTQINNVIGNEEIATNFNNIKNISDWLSANDSNADKMIDAIATLTGTGEGSIAKSIETAIGGLDSEKNASENKYISSIKIVDGKLTEIGETELPVRSVAAGETAGTIAVNGTEITVPGWVSISTDEVSKWNSLETNVQADWDATEGAAMIVNKPTNLVTSDSKFIYTPAEKDAETNEETKPAETQTIEWLFAKVKELEDKLNAAEAKIVELEQYHTTIENGSNEGETPDPETPIT